MQDLSLPPSTEEHLWISWSDYHRMIEHLALQIYNSDWKFDQILCLARGGMRVGDVLSRIFKVPLGVLATSSYREASGMQQGQLDIAQYITMTQGPLAGKVLLTDDMVDTGHTFSRVLDHLKADYPDIQELRAGVLWYKAHSVVKPDYFVEHLPSNPWIHQPFEEYDSLRPDQLQAWMMRGIREN